MVEETKEIENSESPAVRLMRLSYIERIGTLLGIMIGEDISPRKSIVNEFHVSYDTIRNFLNFDSKIKIETILKFCYIIGHYLHEEYEAVERSRSDSVSSSFFFTHSSFSSSISSNGNDGRFLRRFRTI